MSSSTASARRTPGSDVEFEVYVEKFQITKWRDGYVYATQSLGCGWFPTAEVNGNEPRRTNITYVSASDEYACTKSTIRKART